MIVSGRARRFLLCVFAGSLPLSVVGSADLFTYYDEPFTAPDSSVVMRLGPASWPELLVQDNECGGTGQSSGYGQSPVVVPESSMSTCDTDFSGYEFKEGTCTFEQLDFHLSTSGVSVAAKHSSDCYLGKTKVPGSDEYFKAKKIHISASSEHSIGGKYAPAEMQITHKGAHEDTQVAFAMFIDTPKAGGDSASAHSVFEHFLQGWEAVHAQTEQFCAAKPQGTQKFNINQIFASKQQFLTCPAVGSSVSPEEVGQIDWVDHVEEHHEDDADHGHRRAEAMKVPQLKTPDYPAGPIPNIYESLVSTGIANSDIYTYRGGLTKPPCTENVHWNILGASIFVSPDQLDRLHNLILCFTEKSTCRHATVASSFGRTTRPPQPLHGRTVLKRCPEGPPPANGAMVLTDPVSPVTSAAYETSPGHNKPWQAVLYPWFVLTLGVVTYFILSRKIHFLPYTAVMFIFGTLMGIGITTLDNSDHLSVSTEMWSNINSELLFLTFLPGLIFRDAFCLDIHLLKDALVQCLIMAFPMVLAGTALLGLVGFYVLPYGWSFSLSMTFGAILSATDPVAVSALLNEVGAPPRLKMHISGESLLNDGSAMVFYTIFASMFLFEQNIPGLGHDIDVGTGFKLFFQMSLGAVAIGLAFGFVLVRILFMFNRRFSAEESIVQVTATITIAYLCYYVAEAVSHTSGVLAVVTCGVVTKAFGYNMINDQVMMEKFWVLVEHLLNTVLFALGGVVWGTVISNSSSFRSETFSGEDWGYLIVVYIFMMIIRFFLFAVSYPIISRIGLKTSWKEVIFMSFGGLRGAVGIALAIALDNELRKDTVPGDPAQDATSQLFGLVGGVALLTLIINGTLCGPFLRKLGLADATEAREKIVSSYRQNTKTHVLDKLLTKLSDPRFEKADVAIIQKHVPILKDITATDLRSAVKRHKANTPIHEYKKPNLSSFEAIIKDDTLMREINGLARVSSSAKLKGLVMKSALSSSNLGAMEKKFDEEEEASPDKLIELRKIFIELLRYAYKQQVEKGEVEVRKGLVVFTLEQSVEYTEDAVAKGEPICDWDMLKEHKNLLPRKIKETVDQPVVGKLQRAKSKKNASKSTLALYVESSKLEEKKSLVNGTQRAVAFIQAHQEAERFFKEEFTANRFLTNAEQQVLDESRGQVAKAEDKLRSMDPEALEDIMSHLLCTILLNNTASFIGNLVNQGLLKEKEGEEYLHELVEHDLHKVAACVKEKKCKQMILKEKGELGVGETDIESGGGAAGEAHSAIAVLKNRLSIKSVDDNSSNGGSDVLDF